MDEEAIYAVALVGWVLGGALGAKLAKAPVWKGAVLTVIASVVQLAVAVFADIEHPAVNTLIFLLVVGLVGGRWGMKMTARQLSLIVIGGILIGFLAGFAFMYTVISPSTAS
jgi:hypothetical protein